MILSDRDIKKALHDKVIVVKPKPKLDEQLGSSSLDLRLGYHFRVFKHRRLPYVDPFDPTTMVDMTEEVVISKREPYVIQPGEFCLASILEWVELPDNIAARIDGRSSLGRLGLVIHSTAGHIDPGFAGSITMELSNIGMMPILLYPKMRICQLVFEPLSSPAERPYNKKPGAKYAGQKTPAETMLGSEKIS
ncbi:MAG: dCTP deaminase [Candidatus Andersenbacteria bacterium CG10_big_fil_rev_8_21_14_0_10_54_11]|uniref:dCTP deaminase n=1 Tax=Candidatus Andersenbacteria bacterium CG10_big_fil_rev_8_21_14_0_10_54_11 TaxID=1974485 RepID=A0A2M6WYX9_9BACT|nr:MAG: dCTP deaminase [Candidatus Andersenbacteria bacterium CG10_big_fil_rev_8_21_14_0_10_54_11]